MTKTNKKGQLSKKERKISKQISPEKEAKSFLKKFFINDPEEPDTRISSQELYLSFLKTEEDRNEFSAAFKKEQENQEKFNAALKKKDTHKIEEMEKSKVDDSPYSQTPGYTGKRYATAKFISEAISIAHYKIVFSPDDEKANIATDIVKYALDIIQDKGINSHNYSKYGTIFECTYKEKFNYNLQPESWNIVQSEILRSILYHNTPLKVMESIQRDVICKRTEQIPATQIISTYKKQYYDKNKQSLSDKNNRSASKFWYQLEQWAIDFENDRKSLESLDSRLKLHLYSFAATSAINALTWWASSSYNLITFFIVEALILKIYHSLHTEELDQWIELREEVLKDADKNCLEHPVIFNSAPLEQPKDEVSPEFTYSLYQPEKKEPPTGNNTVLTPNNCKQSKEEEIIENPSHEPKGKDSKHGSSNQHNKSKEDKTSKHEKPQKNKEEATPQKETWNYNGKIITETMCKKVKKPGNPSSRFYLYIDKNKSTKEERAPFKAVFDEPKIARPRGDNGITHLQGRSWEVKRRSTASRVNAEELDQKGSYGSTLLVAEEYSATGHHQGRR